MPVATESVVSSAAVEQTPSAVRYVVNLSHPGSPSTYDGMASIWFRDPAATFMDLGLSDDVDAIGTQPLQNVLVVSVEDGMVSGRGRDAA